ncbi:MAG: hypothetical protein EA381_06580 [Planctomycetaceae bacterium]|nr:MAG: hypothetical protein EA381_06580 [Planctomycetaceae bacterium]
MPRPNAEAIDRSPVRCRLPRDVAPNWSNRYLNWHDMAKAGFLARVTQKQKTPENAWFSGVF